MIPKIYIDIQIKSKSPIDVSNTVQSLHACFSNINTYTYAIALPTYDDFEYDFSVIRVFTDSTDSIVELLKRFNKDNSIRIGDIQHVIDDYTGSLIQYRKFKIPTKKQDRLDGTPLHNRRLKEAESLMYFQIKSNSQNRSFRLHFELYNSHGGLSECHPDKYGLCVTTRPFFLPNIPL